MAMEWQDPHDFAKHLKRHGNRTLISEWSNDCSRRLGGYPTFG